MKANIHPTLNPVVFIDKSNGTEFVTTSTLTSEKTKKINGVDHFVIEVEISSASHPFFTGKQMFVDTAGRVDKYMERQKIAAAKKKELVARAEKKTAKEEETLEEKITRKAKEKAEKKEEEQVKKPAKKAAKPVKKSASKKK